MSARKRKAKKQPKLYPCDWCQRQAARLYKVGVLVPACGHHHSREVCGRCKRRYAFWTLPPNEDGRSPSKSHAHPRTNPTRRVNV